jgi:hypothetical protein
MAGIEARGEDVMVKYFEIRDRATYIPAFAVKLWPQTDRDVAVHFGMGWREGNEPVYLVWPAMKLAHYDPYAWADRTMLNAHRHIRDNWGGLESGAVVDVEYILGETDSPKPPQNGPMNAEEADE